MINISCINLTNSQTMTLESSGVNAKLMHERGESTFSLLQLQQALKRHALAIHVNNIFCQSLNND